MNDIKKALVNSFSTKCLMGVCDSCTRIVDGQGIHDIQVFKVYKLLDKKGCKVCKGTGRKPSTCPTCYGTGVLRSFCDHCSGSGAVPDEDGQRKELKRGERLIPSCEYKDGRNTDKRGAQTRAEDSQETAPQDGSSVQEKANKEDSCAQQHPEVLGQQSEKDRELPKKSN